MRRDLEKETWAWRPKGGPPEQFANLPKHVGGNVVLLRTNTSSVVKSSFGTDIPALTFGYPGVMLHHMSMGVETWRSTAKRQLWSLLLRRKVMVMGVEAILGSSL